MKKIVLISLTTFLSLSLANAQVLDASDPQVAAALGSAQVEGSPLSNAFQRRTPMMDKLLQQVRNEKDYQVHYVGAEVGSAYETENYNKGQVYYEDELLGSFYYRYNAFTNEIEVKRTLLKEEEHKALVQDEKVKLVPIKGSPLLYRKYFTKKNDLKEGYLTHIMDGEHYELFRRLRIKFSEARAAENSMVNPKPSKFTNFIEYYIQEKGSEKIVEISQKKAKLLKQFDGVSTEKIKDYIKEKNPNLSQESDLISLFTFIDSLK